MSERQLSQRNNLAAIAVALALVMVLLGSHVPVLDEESYLDIGRQLLPSHPYSWWRLWQPWGDGREADAFIFAHPPLHLLWVWALVHLLGDDAPVRALKIVGGLPWAIIYGLSVSDLARRLSRRPLLAVLAWASAPVVVLGVQRGLMPDLGLAALETAAVALWLRGTGGSRRSQVLGGLALAAAIWTKYPAALLVPVLLVHGRVRWGSWSGALRRMAPFWLAALLPVLVGEAWLAAVYGRLHPWEVLGRAGEIARGELRLRGLGVLVRLSLGVLPVALLAKGLRGNLALGAAVAAVAVVLAWGPADLSPQVALQVWLLATVGASVVVALVQLPRAPSADRGPGEHGDVLLLALWALGTILSVLLVHNFAAPRYLLPAMAPAALVLTRSVEVRPTARSVILGGAVVSAALALFLTRLEHQFFEGSEELATQISHAWASPGNFTGEWSFRWRMRSDGWTFFTPETPSGSLVIAPLNSSPGALPPVKEHIADYGYGHGDWRVAAANCHIGLYGDTLGVLPFGWCPGQLEQATAWRIR